MSTSTSKRPTWQLAVGIFVLLWAVYLLVYSGAFLVIDEQHIFAVAESIALRGAVDANQVRFAPHILPASGLFGPDGNYYTVYGPATSYLVAPLILLARTLPHVGAVQAGLLLPPLLTALTAVLVFLYVQRLVGSPHVGLATALLYGLCTLAVPYTKSLYTDPLSTLALFGMAWALLRYRDEGDLPSLVLAGGLAGLAVTTKVANGIALPAFLIYGLWAFRRAGRPSLRRTVLATLAFGLPLAAFLAGLALFNLVRLGSPLSTGYVAYSMQFSTPPWEGLYGLLLSPGKGFFWYSPILLLWPFALPAFLRRHAPEALLGLAVSLVLLVPYSMYFAWYAGTCWGPRYLVPLVPFVLVGTMPALRWLWHRWPGRIALALLALLSAGVQFLGVGVSFSHYLSRLERQIPNAEATVALFDPRYSPLVGHAGLALNPHNLNFAWLQRPADLAGRGVGSVIYVDWVPVLLALALAGLALAGLVWVRGRTLILGLALVGVVMVPWVSLVRYYDDPRYGSGEPHRALLGHLEATVAPSDAVISHDAARINFYLNYSHVTAPWYGVPREALPLSPETTALMERLAGEHRRLWVILPNTPTGDPASGVERWLAEHACPATDTSFGPNLRLASFAVSGDLAWRDSGITLSDTVRLEAFALPDADAPLVPGDVLCLALRWRCLAPLPADYTVFVQLLGPDGLPASQSDRQPVAGFRPTSGWQPDQVIVDRHGVSLPADPSAGSGPGLPPGEYRLIAGLYRVDTGARLPTPTGDFIDLGVVRISPR